MGNKSPSADKKPVTLYVLLLTYALLLYGGAQSVERLVSTSPDLLWAGIIVTLFILTGVISLFFRKKWSYVWNIILLSLILVLQITYIINRISAGTVTDRSLPVIALVLVIFAALMFFFIRNTQYYFLVKDKKEAPSAPPSIEK